MISSVRLNVCSSQMHFLCDNNAQMNSVQNERSTIVLLIQSTHDTTLAIHNTTNYMYPMGARISTRSPADWEPWTAHHRTKSHK